MFDNIPDEIKAYPQWCIWRYEERQSEKPTKVPYSARTGRIASVTDSNTWATFDEAKNAHRLSGYDGIGFILTENDPFTFIDLDDTKGNPVALEHQLKIYQEFDSYAERSPSGTGLHIIIKAKMPAGRRKQFVEIYSDRRYMTMTGNVYRNKPIEEYHALANTLWSQMALSFAHNLVYSGATPETESDENIISKMINAENGIKAKALLVGNWHEYYPSQSEADFALINIIAFYTQNKTQIIRIFRNSALGQREKASRIDYLNWMINKSFDRMLPPIDTDALRNQIENAIQLNKPETKREKKNISFEYTFPVGLVGEIANFILKNSPRPVPEIALAGALGFFAGIVGRAYNVSGTGLNQYILLLAKTGVGKEGIAKGISSLINEAITVVPSASNFIGPGKINSEQALINYMGGTKNSFTCVVGEFGKRLYEMSGKHAPTHLQGLLTFLMDIFNKSGNGDVYRPSIYSDKAKNSKELISPAVSIIGESTQSSFYDSLNESMIIDGLLPRFTIIEYEGMRPPLNENHSIKPSISLKEQLLSVCTFSLQLNSQNKCINVLYDHESTVFLKEFDKFCDDKVNNSDKNTTRDLWNRGHIKVLKLAALIAVGVNPYEPIITLDIAKWSKSIIENDILKIQSRFDSGEVGDNKEEILQAKAMIKNCIKYSSSEWSSLKGYKAGTYESHRNKYIPYSYLHKRLSLNVAFKADKRGATDAIKRTIRTLIERGDLEQVNPVELSRDFGLSGNYYIIKNMSLFYNEGKEK